MTTDYRFRRVFGRDLAPHQGDADTPAALVQSCADTVAWLRDNDPAGLEGMLPLADVPAFLQWIDDNRAWLEAGVSSYFGGEA